MLPSGWFGMSRRGCELLLVFRPEYREAIDRMGALRESARDEALEIAESVMTEKHVFITAPERLMILLWERHPLFYVCYYDDKIPVL